MDNREILLTKLEILVKEIDEAIIVVDYDKKKYLNNYKIKVKMLIKKLQEGTLPSSNGGLMGTMRWISEYDSLASIRELYDAASDVDLFYSRKCKTW